jgi:hypothetical protein
MVDGIIEVKKDKKEEKNILSGFVEQTGFNKLGYTPFFYGIQQKEGIRFEPDSPDCQHYWNSVYKKKCEVKADKSNL